MIRSKGLLLSLILLCVVSGKSVANTLPHTFTAGTVASASEINANFTAIIDMVMPVGSITAWHKSLSGTAALPDNWVECNGSTINDPESPLHGQVAPNLNGDSRFLRGGSVSGVEQADALQEHNHSYSRTNPIVVNLATSGTEQTPQSFQIQEVSQDSSGVKGANVDTETRPINMSVVWIMRIK